MTTKTFWKHFATFAQRGYGEITTCKFAADRLHPTIAKQLLNRGWAEYERDHKGFITTLLRITETGKKEAEIAADRSEANVA